MGYFKRISESREFTNEMCDNNYNYSYEKGKRLFLKSVSISSLRLQAT